MKNIIFTLIFLFATAPIFCQDSPIVSNQRVSQAGGEFIIDFDIQFKEANQWCALAVYISVDGGGIFKRTPLKALSGDVDYVSGIGSKTIIWKAKEEDISLLPGDNLAFKIEVEDLGVIAGGQSVTVSPQFTTKLNVVEIKKVKSKPTKSRQAKPKVKKSVIVMALVGLSPNLMSGYRNDVYDISDITYSPELSYGFGLGYAFGRFGFYAKFRSNFNFKIIDYRAMSQDIWTTGESKILNTVGTGGIIIGLTNWLQIYGGAGYGNRTLAWEDVDGNWAGVNENSHTGVAVDAGVILKLGPFFLSGGITTTNFSYTDMELGVGIFF